VDAARPRRRCRNQLWLLPGASAAFGLASRSEGLAQLSDTPTRWWDAGVIASVRPRRNFQAMEKLRERAAELFARGVSQADVARELDVSRQSVSRWQASFRHGGAEALRGAGRAGRKPRLTASDLKRLEQALRRGARASGYPTELWTLPRVTEPTESLLGVSYHPGHALRLMGQPYCGSTTNGTLLAAFATRSSSCNSSREVSDLLNTSTTNSGTVTRAWANS